jgi:hypothetical protein
LNFFEDVRQEEYMTKEKHASSISEALVEELRDKKRFKYHIGRKIISYNPYKREIMAS